MFDDLSKDDTQQNITPPTPQAPIQASSFNNGVKGKEMSQSPVSASPLNSKNLSMSDDKKVEDIFSETDTGAVAPPQGILNSTPASFGNQSTEVSEKSMKKIGFFAIIIVGLLLVVFIGFIIVDKFLTPRIVPVVEEEVGLESSKPEQEEIQINIPETEEDTEEDIIITEPTEKDSDGDGLSDKEELELGTSLYNVDTDDDGLFDKEEVEIYKTDPLNADTDNDGYLDGEEVKNAQNPNGKGDLIGLPNGSSVNRLEIVGSTESASSESEIIIEVNLDSDQDGILDKDEYDLGTDPMSSDTDNDGLSDYSEVYEYLTDPLNADSDQDGYLDGEEVKNGYNPKGEGKL